MSKHTKTIRTWWLNRAVSYLIPALFLYYAAATAFRGDFSSAAVNFLIAASIFMFAEHFWFSYKVDLSQAELIYREGLFASAPIVIERERIKSAYFLQLSGLSKVKSKRLLIEAEDLGTQILSLASFKPKDVKAIVDWIPSGKMVKEGAISRRSNQRGRG